MQLYSIKFDDDFLQSYRARYESEGCRGPIRGVSENGFPTVRVCTHLKFFNIFRYLIIMVLYFQSLHFEFELFLISSMACFC